MKGRSTLVLLIGILALGAFIWIQETIRARSPSKEYQRVKLFDMDPATLTSVRFSTSNSVVECVKQNGVWMVDDPSRGMGRADVALVYRMVGGLNSMGKGTTITAKHLEIRGLDASEYGFDAPAVGIEAVDNQGRHRWMIGRKTPLGDMVYVRGANNDDIYTVPNLLLSFVPASADELRDRILFPGEPSGVRRLEIRGPAGFVRIVKDPSNGWRIQQPIVAPADPLEVAAYVERLYRVRIEGFVADNVPDLSVYGLQGEVKQISLVSADGSSRMLVLGDKISGRPGFIYARRADDTSVFSLPESVLKTLEVPMDRFRDARVLALPKEEISSILVKRGTEQLSMAMDPSGAWRITSPIMWDADPDAVSKLVGFWGHAVVTEFDVASSDAAPAADWVLEFTSNRSGATNRIEVLPSSGGRDGLLVRRDDDSAVCRINLPVVPGSIIDPLVYKNKHVWRLSKADVNKLSILRAKQPRQVVELQADGSFAFIETDGNARVDAAALDRLLTRLASIRTPEYIAYNTRNLEIYGLDKPTLELYVGLVDPNEIGRVLLVGNEAADGFYSMVKGRDVVFYLDKSTVDALSADLAVKPVDPASIAK